MITEDQKRESCILLNKLKILINEATILNNINDLYTGVEEVFTDFSKSISNSISETKEKLVEVSTKRTEEIEQSLETLKKDVKSAITSASEGFESSTSGSSSSSGDVVNDTTTSTEEDGTSSSITTPPSGITASGVDAETAKSVFEELAIGIDEAITKNNNSIKIALENVTTGIEESIDETLPTTFDKISKTWYEAKRDLIIDEINKTLNELSTKIQYNI